tara:strand:+ start:407 stop:859 length:453 start_codon:yes stop_codon:yes gene_type:complete
MPAKVKTKNSRRKNKGTKTKVSKNKKVVKKVSATSVASATVAPVAPVAPVVPASSTNLLDDDTPDIKPIPAVKDVKKVGLRSEEDCLLEIDEAFNSSFEELKHFINATKLVLADQRRLHRHARREVKEAGRRRRKIKNIQTDDDQTQLSI